MRTITAQTLGRSQRARSGLAGHSLAGPDPLSHLPADLCDDEMDEVDMH